MWLYPDGDMEGSCMVDPYLVAVIVFQKCFIKYAVPKVL